MTKRILVTGGAGYIGSHTCLELLAAGFEVVALDGRRIDKVLATRLPHAPHDDAD